MQGLLEGRLGLDVPRDAWPSTATLKSWEAAGYGWAQLHAPPPPMLRDRELARRHARALRAVLEPTGLRLLLRAPAGLRAGTPADDAAFAGLLDHAAESGAELVAYRGCDVPCTLAPGAMAERLALEERALRRFAEPARRIGVRVCVVNGAPAYPAPLAVGHDPEAVAALVRRLAAPSFAMGFDLGHAHVVASLEGTDVASLLVAALDVVALFGVHDNFGARHHGLQAPGVDPLRLDLHLPPGAGSLPWDAVGPLVRAHRAPLALELHGARPDVLELAQRTAGLLSRTGDAQAAAA